MANSGSVARDAEHYLTSKSWRVYLTVLVFAGAIYLGFCKSPPSLMDDVDAIQAQIARNMLTSGDWVTARLDGVSYLEKAPLIYWIMAISYKIFGVHDWAARIPVVLSILALAWLTGAFGVWAFGKRAGLCAGLCMGTCAGVFLFTRILIPDIMLTFTIALAMWAFLRTLDEQEPHPRLWAFVLAASLGTGLLLKSLVSVVFPVAAALIYLFFTKQLFTLRTWKRLRPISGFIIALAIAAPWHILATIRNPPYFSFSLHGGPGEYHGFLWFYFINEQVLRFLNLRYPRDYNTVPRLWFWLFHLLWLFPWSVYFPAVAKLSFIPVDRAGRARLLAICWIGFILVFFTFSTTQEYYSMPCYPAMALLLGSAMAEGDNWIRRGTRALSVITGCAGLACITIFFLVRNLPAPGDISSALGHHPSVYTLSLGHMMDLTFDSFAYLRLPLAVAAIALAGGALATSRWIDLRSFLGAALMMVLFYHAARLALVVFDPFLSSRPLVEALLKAPDGELIVNHNYWTFSSVTFYANRDALNLNGRYFNLEYGSYAPHAPDVFIDDTGFKSRWHEPQRYYLVAYLSDLEHFKGLVGQDRLNIVTASGGKVLLTNHPLGRAGPAKGMPHLSAAFKN
ncbi:MAG TPA: glycosyltransferase family 39 protein [Candidatus Polarisedimenticolia bacterium]|nr:glycosyltransferase family 39 protein [Candidatus Polarisedimenticolia bacterium]